MNLNGTGLGAISSDETQNGATDVPNVQFKVWVGNQSAAVISAGRGAWTGLPDGFPTFPVPQTVAAWDVRSARRRLRSRPCGRSNRKFRE